MKIADLPAGWKKVGREFQKPLCKGRTLVVFKRVDQGWMLAEDRPGSGLWPFTAYNTAGDAIRAAERIRWR